LWNLPADKFRRTDCSTADKICCDTAIVFSHIWLLAERPVVEKLAAAIEKVALNLGR
jgi:hypothetical protein